jgi:ribose 5-phosphate isomerase B
MVNIFVDMNKSIGLAADHAGFELKEYLKKKLLEWGYTVHDFGTNSEQSVDYPDFIHPLAAAMRKGTINRGLVICGSGQGVSITANKYSIIRCALSWTPEIAKLSREHNDSNVLALPSRFISEAVAVETLQFFLNTEFEGGRHQNRINKINPV